MRLTALIHARPLSFRKRGQSTLSMEALLTISNGPFPSGAGLQIFGGLMKTELALYQALIAINVPEQKERCH